MSESFEAPQNPVKLEQIKKDKSRKIIESKTYGLLLQKDEYELVINIYSDSFIEFKLMQKNNISSSYYIEEYNLENINKKSSLFCKEIKEIFHFYNKILQENNAKLLYLKEKNKFCLNFKNIFNEEKEINLELKEVKLNKDEIIQALINEVILLKKKVNENENINNEKMKNDLKNEMIFTIYEIEKGKNKKYNELEKRFFELEKKNTENENKINEIKTNYENVIYDLKTNMTELLEENKKRKEEEEEKRKKEEEEIRKKEEMEKQEMRNKEEEKRKKEEKIRKKEEMEKQEMRKKEEKIRKKEEEEKRKKEEMEKQEKIKKEEEKSYTSSYDINSINNFKFKNIDKLKSNNIISNNINIENKKSVAAFCIIKNNERLYEVAYPDNKIGYNIIFYNILLNKIENRINNAHSKNIHTIKHYFCSHLKCHILLTSSYDKSIKLWNISSKPISNILTINNCFDGGNLSPFCLLFTEASFFIFGGSKKEKKKIWNQGGELIGSIEKSNLYYATFIEAEYIENNPYILLSGQYHSECYNYNNNTIKIYMNSNINNDNIAILFNKNKNIYLITGDDGGRISIFDFITTYLIKEIETGKCINSLCLINEKYFFASKGYNLAIIDMDKYSIVKEYTGHNSFIFGIEKIKIYEQDEYIITYDYNSIKLWG